MTALMIILLQVSATVPLPLWQQVARSGRAIEQGESESQRVTPKLQLAPGPPPLLQFRLLEGKLRHRFGESSLVLDDAGH